MMSRLRAIAFALERGVADATRRPLLAAAIVLAVAASLFAVGLVRLTSHNLKQHVERSASEPQLVVFLDADASLLRAADVSQVLALLEGTVHTRIVSGAEARTRLEVAMADDAALLADLDDAFFPISIEVTLRDGLREAAALHPFVERLEAVRGVDSVEVVGDWVDRASALFAALAAASQLLLVLLGGCGAFIVAALMRLATDNLEGERAVFWRLGASPAFSVGPLIVSGALRGALGGAVACLVLYACYASAGGSVSAALDASVGRGSIEFLPVRDLALLIAGGAVVGGLGAACAGRGDVA